jgi:RNA recognition motif-containing protein
LLNIFEGFAPIKDIRMIRNKISGGNKDFAFVEFFSPDEAAYALKKTN